MMKKLTYVLLAIVCLGAIYVYTNKLYYPPHPVDSVSKNKLYELGMQADEQLRFVTATDERHWYITQNSNDVQQLLVQFAAQHGWRYTEQNGSGYFFERGDETLIMTTKMWSTNFKLIKVPKHIDH